MLAKLLFPGRLSIWADFQEIILSSKLILSAKLVLSIKMLVVGMVIVYLIIIFLDFVFLSGNRLLWIRMCLVFGMEPIIWQSSWFEVLNIISRRLVLITNHLSKNGYLRHMS